MRGLGDHAETASAQGLHDLFPPLGDLQDAQGDRMIGFDFRPNRWCPVAHDIGRFLIYLDVYRILPATKDFKNKALRVPRCSKKS
jgi:hypothetical protein